MNEKVRKANESMIDVLAQGNQVRVRSVAAGPAAVFRRMQAPADWQELPRSVSGIRGTFVLPLCGQDFSVL